MVDIILVLYGDRSDLDRCIASIKKHCIGYKIFIHDNNKKNIGFTVACNSLVKQGQGDKIWLLNQDAIVTEGAMEALVQRLDSSERVGIAGSMQIDYDDRDLIRLGGLGRCFPAGQHLGGRLSMGHCQIPSKQCWMNGASLMVKRPVYQAVGPMDERYFLLYSDSDFSFEVRQAGFDIWYEPRSRVIHRLGKASKSSSEWQQKDMQAFMKKWGITHTGEQFVYSRKFQKLDMFP